MNQAVRSDTTAPAPVAAVPQVAIPPAPQSAIAPVEGVAA